MRAIATCILFLVPPTIALSLSRRELVQNGLMLTGTSVFVIPEPANAARGAAELDLEFYVRDLIGGNRKEGNVSPSTPPVVSPPRALKGPLIPLLLNDECSSACLSTLALVQQVKVATGKNEQLIEKDIQDRVQEYKKGAKASFYAKAPWKEEHVTDQYYFDLTAYALWRTAADVLPNYTYRDRFVRQLGRLIYEKSQSTGLLQKRPSKGSVVGTIGCMTEMLDLFDSSKFCKGYRIGEEDRKGTTEKSIVFDELDDDALASGASVDCLVSIFEPAILGASLQITGEQSRFAPDFVGATLAAMWEDANIQSSWETFFVDPEYRPNPKDYFPNEKLMQFTLTRR